MMIRTMRTCRFVTLDDETDMLLRTASLHVIITGLLAIPARADQLTGISGVSVDDQLFVAYAKHFPKEHTFGSKLMRASWDEADPRLAWRPTTRVPYDSPVIGSARQGVSKITLAHDRLWAVGPGDELFHAIPINDLHYFEDNDWAVKRERAKFGKHALNIGGPYGYWVNHLFIPEDRDGQNAIHNALAKSGWRGFNEVPIHFKD